MKYSNPMENGCKLAAAEGQVELASVVPDTPQDAQVRMSRLHAKWLEASTGTRLPYRFEEEGTHVFCEVSPLLSYEGEGLGPECIVGLDLRKSLLLD